MSQVWKILTSGGPFPPNIPTSFVGDVGIAIPAANILNVPSNDSTINVDNGIQTQGSGNTLAVVLTNRLQGASSSVGAVSTNIITFTPTVAGTYSIEYRVAAFNATSTLGAGYSLFGAIRFDGVNSFICDTFDEIVNEEGTMTNVDIEVILASPNVILRGTGYALQTINWSAVGLYTYVGA